MSSTILIVDDEVQVVNALRRLFRRSSSYEIITATSGAEALEKLHHISPSVIISDMRMPQMDGLTFLTQSRVLAPESIRIVLSAYADINLIIGAVNSGDIWQYILKPWDDQQLVVTVANAVDLYTIKERKREYQRQLEQLNKKLQSIITSVSDGVVVTDQSGAIILANPLFRSFCKEEVKGFSIYQLCSLFGIESGVETLLEVGRFLGKLEERYFEFSVGHYEKSRHIGGSLVLIIRDMTKEKELEQLKDRFVASVSHELRTPLSSIIGFSKMMLRNENLPISERSEFLNIILEEGTRLSNLVENILNFSSIEAGKVHYSFQKISLLSLLSKAITIMEGEAKKRGVELEIIHQRFDDTIWADSSAIRQVLINLIQNGIKFNREGGKIVFTLSKEEGTVILSVADTGVGIPSDKIEQIFDRFFRAHNQQAKGTGIGLSVVQEIIHEHGGRVEVSSVVGEGTIFTLFFPELVE